MVIEKPMKKEQIQALAFNLEKIRAERNMTTTELSEKSGISATTISFIENAKETRVRLNTLFKLCTALECTLVDLLNDCENEEGE